MSCHAEAYQAFTELCDKPRNCSKLTRLSMADSTHGATGALPPGAALRPSRAAEEAAREAMREAARAFEAAFLAEMLKHAGLGETPDAFGGGVGEDQFASLMREAQARHMAESGGIGIAEQVFEAMIARERGDG
jgi:hypothetical protein